MNRLLTIFCACAIAAFAFASVASAGADGRDAGAKACAAEKKGDKAAFNAYYGKHAMHSCKKGTGADPTVAEFKNAAKECKAERDADAAAFQTDYGTNGNGRNALGKCVSEKVKSGDDDGDDGDDDGGDGDDTPIEEPPLT